MPLLTNTILGLIAGLLCGLGGALKDSPHEGFHALTFLRSPALGTLGGILSGWFTPDPILAFCFAGYFERCTAEGYKILRQQAPGKFFWKHKHG